MARGVDALKPSRLRGAHSPRLPWWAGAALAAATVAVLVLVPLYALVREAGELPFARIVGDPWLRRVLAFSLKQAALSTVLSVGLAIPVALALSHERRFPGRRALVSLFGLSLVLPAIVAVYGIVAVWGGGGWVNGVLEPLGLELPALYGLGGILLAHVFFNLPLSARVLLQALDGVPDAHWRLAAQLGMPLGARVRHIEWPALLRPLPGLVTLVFTLCFTSFAIVLTLGGGPRATTVEVAIYQALRFDFDLPLAVALALVQLLLCLLLTVLGAFVASGNDASLGGGSFAADALPAWHPHARRGAVHRGLDAFAIAATALLVVPPLAALVVAGVNPKSLGTATDPVTLAALRNTVVAALCAAALSVALALGLLGGVRHLHARLGRARAGEALQSVGNAILVLPPIVLGTGLFLALRTHADVFSLALVLVVLVNALISLPFALRILSGPMLRGAAATDRLVRSLGMSRWQRWRLVDWPVLRRPLGLAAGVAATLTAGDLGAIALFGSERFRTLSSLLHSRLGGYRLQEAAATAALLLLLCIVLFVALQRLIGGPRERDGTLPVPAEASVR